MSARVTQIHFDVAGKLGGSGVRVTNAFLSAAYTDKTEGVRVSQEHVTVAYSDKTRGAQVTNVFLVFAAPFPTIDLESDPFDDAEIYTFGMDSVFNPVTTAAANIEPNPYAPIIHNTAIADMPPAVAGVLGPQQEMIRKQHNITQAGDTTFPWDLIQDTTPTQDYNLGSQGTFFTPYGIIKATYVQFGSMDHTPTYGMMPYGRVKNTNLVDWKVTNDITKSDADWCVGIAMMSAVPPEGEYGWVVTSGPNISKLLCTTPGLPQMDDTYVWSRTGGVGRNVPGRIIARQWGTGGVLDPGNLFVSMEGPNDARLTSLFDADFTSIENAIQQLQAEIAALQGTNPSGIADRVTATEQAIALLQIALAKESATRSQRDLELTDAIRNGLVTLEQFNEYKEELNTSLTASLNAITDSVNAANQAVASIARATAGLNAVAINAKFDADDLRYQMLFQELNRLLNTVAALGAPVIPLLPLTVGTPPGFFWFDDGKYMITETRNA